MTTLAEAAVARAAGGQYAARSDRPSERRMDFASDAAPGAPVVLRAGGVKEVERADGSTATVVFGMASVTEVGYEMYDMFGPYTEVVSLDAFDATLGKDPLVEFTLNHNRGGGLPMAHTRNETLELAAIKDGEETGLSYEADVDPSRGDVSDMLKALKRGDLAEASFKFRIVRGQWSPDYMEYRILEVDLHRGDVSAVNFGANPAAWSAARDTEEPTAEEREEQRPPVVFRDEDFERITVRGVRA